MAEVLTANGVQVALCQSDAPTPVIALRSCTAKPQEGQRDRQPIRRTIRHQIFHFVGRTALPEVTRYIEERCAYYLNEGKIISRIPLSEGRKKKLVVDFDPAPHYLEAHEKSG